MMHKRHTLISALQLTTIDEKYMKLLLQSEITALAYEFIKDEKFEVCIPLEVNVIDSASTSTST